MPKKGEKKKEKPKPKVELGKMAIPKEGQPEEKSKKDKLPSIKAFNDIDKGKKDGGLYYLS